MSGHYRGGSNFFNLFSRFKPKYLIHSYEDFPKNLDIDYYKFFSEKDCSHISQDEIDLYKHNSRPETNVENTLNMFRKRFVCIQDFNLISKEYNDNEIYIYIRPDLSLDLSRINLYFLYNYMNEHIKQIPNSLLIPSGGDFHGGIFDCMAIGNKHSIIRYLNTYSSLSNAFVYNNYVFHPESLLRRYLQDISNIPIFRFNNIDCILRGNKLNI